MACCGPVCALDATKTVALHLCVISFVLFCNHCRIVFCGISLYLFLARQYNKWECVQASSRDALARQMGQTAAAKLRNRAASARRAAPPLTPGTMPPPTSGLRRKPGGTPSGVALSSAGRKLAQSLAGPGASTDAQLRASYSASPAQRAGGTTPGQSGLRRSVTPAWTPRTGVPAAAELRTVTPGSAASKGSLTDDLLNI